MSFTKIQMDKRIKKIGVFLPTVWHPISQQEVAIAKTLCNQNKNLLYETYTLPTDGANNFHDCDFWLIISDKLTHPLFPLKPYGMIIYDYLQRYHPKNFSCHFSDTHCILSARHADFVLTPTPFTQQDAIQYAAISPERIHLAPTAVDTWKNLASEFWDLTRNLT